MATVKFSINIRQTRAMPAMIVRRINPVSTTGQAYDLMQLELPNDTLNPGLQIPH